MREQDENNTVETRRAHGAHDAKVAASNAATVAAEEAERQRLAGMTDAERRNESHAATMIRNQEQADVDLRLAKHRYEKDVADGTMSDRRRSAMLPPYQDPAPPNKMQGSQDLEAQTVDQLRALAAAKGITVTRGDGKDGEPLKADYIRALKS